MKASEILIVDGLTKFDAKAVKKASGAIMVDGMHIADTLRCVHCGHTWIPITGSGRVRGFCTKCNGVTCGSHQCNTCMPLEKRLDLYEKGKLNKL